MKILPRRPLYIQVIFTILAFAAMVFLSFFYMRETVHHNLVRNAQSVFSFAQTQLEADLLEPKMVFMSFSQSARGIIMRGESAEVIKNYIDDITDYFHSSGSRIMSSVVMLGYFYLPDKEPVFLFNKGVMPINYDPVTRPWFLLADANCGELIETPPYESLLTGNSVVTYSQCITDDDGRRIGVVALEVNIGDIGTNVVNIAVEQGGYGMLISQDLTVIAHANPEFINLYVMDPDMPLSVFMDDFEKGNDVIERSMVNWKGEATVAFFRKLSNGWYLGLLTPERPFYESLTNMAFTLTMLGIIFAAALVVILIRVDAARSKSDRESRHKSAFLANMSHEIRTPMNAIIGMTTIGKSNPDISRKDHCFSKIEDASNHLLGVINDILDMSKIEANKFELSVHEFIFERMLQRVVNVVNFRVDEKHQNFTVFIDPNIPKSLIGDEQRIAQVITNLLGNAIKFTPPHGSIVLDARNINEVDGLCKIQFSITDTGIGISAEQQERIFSSFEQAEISTTRKYGGTGLGLTISKNIVELMDGRIWMVSEINKGSTFSFVIPLKRGVQIHQGLLSADVNLNNVRIMVVDDDRDILDYFAEISHEFKVNCDTAISGEEAIKLIKEKGKYHIYFIDWKMPGMDGIQLASELKAHYDSSESIVIMITAAEWTNVEKTARAAGVDKFLSKPLFPSHIADILNEALGIDRKKIEEEKCNIEGMFKGRKILLAEDVDINRDIVMELLSPTEIEIDWAENGKEAVRMFSEAPDKYDIIFMDIQMPEMDGYEATRRIRALKIPQAQNIRIVAMTANVFREDIERCLEAGMNNHLGKPLDFSDVIAKLRHYLT
ncbi:MAG: response regulator [Treponema sp.]|nr:response regulator [Treponema sp.]